MRNTNLELKAQNVRKLGYWHIFFFEKKKNIAYDMEESREKIGQVSRRKKILF